MNKTKSLKKLQKNRALRMANISQQDVKTTSKDSQSHLLIMRSCDSELKHQKESSIISVKLV